jgi:predicted  nucleic acid-binding Zn-ribbon protein
MSYSQDAISDLQSDSRQHTLSIEAHSDRFNTIESMVHARLQKINNSIDTLVDEQSNQISHQKSLTKEIETLTNTLPMITDAIELQQNRHNAYTRNQNEINDSTINEIQLLKNIQAQQHQVIIDLEQMVRTLQDKTHSTPISQQRVRKNTKTGPTTSIHHQEHTTPQQTKLQCSNIYVQQQTYQI